MSRRAGSKKPKDPNAPKGALSSYFIFSNERRSALMAENKDKKITEISKLISAEWKEIRAEDKAKYQQRAVDLKTEYKLKLAEYQKTDNYKTYQIKLTEWKEMQKNLGRNESNADDGKPIPKISLPRKPKDKNAPKKPSSSYFLFAATVRAAVKSENPTIKVTEIAKIIGQKWKDLSDDQKKPFADDATRLKELHKPKIEAYAKSEESKEFQKKLEEWKSECGRRKAAAYAKVAKAAEKERLAKEKARGKGKGNATKKRKQKKFEESSESESSSEDSDDSDMSDSSSGSGSSSYESDSD